MRAARLLLILLCTVAGSVAQAGNRIVLLTDPGRGELPRALQVALANRHVDVASLPGPEGALRLDRAAMVVRAALSNAADAGVWIDEDASGAEVCVVSSDGRQLRHAPLPADVPPRVFAAIAASLLDELLAPPEAPNGGVGVDVYVDVHSDAPGVMPAPPMPPSPPAAVTFAPPRYAGVPMPPGVFAATTPAAVVTSSVDPSRSNRTVVEIGVTATPVTVGIEGELAFPVAPSWRLGVLVGVNVLWDSIDDEIFQAMPGGAMYDTGLELRHVGRGETHFDVGLAGGLVWAGTPDEMSGFAAVRLSVTHEYAGSSLSLSLSPTVLLGVGYDDTFMPGAMASLRWGSPI